MGKGSAMDSSMESELEMQPPGEPQRLGPGIRQLVKDFVLRPAFASV